MSLGKVLIGGGSNWSNKEKNKYREEYIEDDGYQL